jgi:hypothetical protein
MFHEFQWPTSGTRRVEHGQQVEFDLLLFNTTETGFENCDLTAHVFAARGGNSLRSVLRTKMNLPAQTTAHTVGHFQVRFDNKTFPAGVYVVRATLRDQEGYELDSQAVRVYVAQDPPFRAPFDFVPEDWSGYPSWRSVSHTFSPAPDPKLTYNYKHPRYLDAEMAGTEDLGYYLYGLSVQGIIQYSLFLARDGGRAYPKVYDKKKIASGDPCEIAEDLHKVQGLLMASWKRGR